MNLPRRLTLSMSEALSAEELTGTTASPAPTSGAGQRQTDTPPEGADHSDVAVSQEGGRSSKAVQLTPIAEMLAERNSIERKIVALDKQRTLHPETRREVWEEIMRLDGRSLKCLESIVTMPAQSIDDMMIKLRAHKTDMRQTEVDNEKLPFEHFADVWGDHFFAGMTLHALCHDAYRLAPQVEVVCAREQIDPGPILAPGAPKPAVSIADAETSIAATAPTVTSLAAMLSCVLAAEEQANQAVFAAADNPGTSEDVYHAVENVLDCSVSTTHSIEEAIWIMPARTPQELMVKLAIAYQWVMEKLPPSEPLPADYFTDEEGTVDPVDTADKKAMNALWQDAVAMFGLPSVTYYEGPKS